MAIKPQQWKAWLRLEETVEFFSDLEFMRHDLLEAWAVGDFTRESAEATAMLNAKALGQLQMLDNILDLRTDKGAENAIE